MDEGKNMNTQQQILLSQRAALKTGHVLHLILTIFTAGFWIIPWVLVALSNKIERSRIDAKIMRAETNQ
jgi:hypothetical protein